MKNSFPSVILSVAKNLAMLSIAAIMLIACGGDNGSSAKDEDSSSSVADEEKSSSSTKNGSSSDKESSSSAKESSSSSVAKYVCDIYTLADALSCKCDENREGKLSYNYDSNVELVCIHDAELNKWGWIVKKDESSSSSEARSSSSSAKSSSSSSVILSSSSEGSSSSVKSSSSVASSSSAKSSSSTAKSSSSVASSSSAKSSSSSVKISSSSEYVPFDHAKFLSKAKYEDGVYKQFTDERTGRSYYYITITGRDTSYKANSVTVMAENLNIGEMVRGRTNQEDDSKIERYCYDNDTTNCDKYGGLYQWAEMMALPSRCNTESCADLIQKNHQGICPEGWRLLTYNDMYTIVHADGNEDGIKGVRSVPFGGFNTTGYSLVGAGYLFNQSFRNVNTGTYWYYPEELNIETVRSSFSASTSTILEFDNVLKTQGFSVRCVMVE
ncbi:major paralogous domain-containing protein [Fibrobacter sp. UWH5]|uniref:FISUMP domain-containing protein n=1 Tax=Fibrobacter sp. UWH5 TaxID=1896211 RepID=UPI000916099D|nr:FISUMP domain-containing protein [Fibrobacter sp. UWH5]SHK27575.1 major paralogous domain-containing protein [Fibrobacter sp. UWH5]